jgi:hypothetical protein
VATDELGNSPKKALYDRLNQLLAEVEFDRKPEVAAELYYKTTSR